MKFIHSKIEVEQMRVIITLFWAFLIIAALNYVLTNMAGVPFDLTQTIAYTIFAVLAIFILDGVLSSVEQD